MKTTGIYFWKQTSRKSSVLYPASYYWFWLGGWEQHDSVTDTTVGGNKQSITVSNKNIMLNET